MPLPLDNTLADGTNGTASNAYCTQAYADAYHTDDRLFSDTAWASLSSDDKDTCILWATRMLDARYIWKGIKVYNNQALEWPRKLAYDDDGVLIGWDYDTLAYEYPKELQDASAELAYQLSLSDRTTDQTGGLKSLKVDVIGLVFNDEKMVDELSESVMSMLSNIGSLKSHPRDNAPGTVFLGRA